MAIFSVYVVNKAGGLIYQLDHYAPRSESEKTFSFPLELVLRPHDERVLVAFGQRDGIRGEWPALCTRSGVVALLCSQGQVGMAFSAVSYSGTFSAGHQRRGRQWEIYGRREGRAGIPEQPGQLSCVDSLWPPAAFVQRKAHAGFHVPLVSWLRGRQRGGGAAALPPRGASNRRSPCAQVVRDRLPIVSRTGKLRDRDAGDRHL